MKKTDLFDASRGAFATRDAMSEPDAAPTVDNDGYWKDVGLGKGAWQCDDDGGFEIKPDEEGAIFEEIPTATSERFEIIPYVLTVPPRTDEEHVAVFFDGCRYRLAFPDLAKSVRALKEALVRGGLGAGAEMTTGRRAVLDNGADDLVIFYRMVEMEDDKSVESYGVPVGCKILLGCDRRLVERARKGLGPGEDDDYWA